MMMKPALSFCWLCFSFKAYTTYALGVKPSLASVHTGMQAKWRPEIRNTEADWRLGGNASVTHCKLAVVGAGWGGAYAAWRMAIDDGSLVGPSEVCIFEANGRAGGRILSVRYLPGLGDLTIDAGGYRFRDSDVLVGSLVRQALKFPTQCYDYNCSALCEGGGNCHVIQDAYGNNAGYATPIETMLAQVESAGEGRQVFFGKELTGVYPSGVPRQVLLAFADGTQVTAGSVILNLPKPSIEGLNPGSVLFTGVTRRASSDLRKVLGRFGAKVYAYYEDAWWNSKLGLLQGDFYSQKTAIPLAGRYHDGPMKCIIGETPAGDPIYSGRKIRHGNCSGALLVYYDWQDAFFQKFMRKPSEPLTIFQEGVEDNSSTKVLYDVHASLMNYHTGAFAAAGIDPETVKRPSLVLVSNWLAEVPVTPACGLFAGGNRDRAVIRAPASAFNVFIADVDYGYSQCWAEGSVIMAEKILQAEFSLKRPAWLDEAWYEEQILRVP